MVVVVMMISLRQRSGLYWATTGVAVAFLLAWDSKQWSSRARYTRNTDCSKCLSRFFSNIGMKVGPSGATIRSRPQMNHAKHME